MSKAASITLDDIKSGWKNMLMDISSDTDDWAQDIAKIMTEQLADELIFNDDWNKQQKEWLDRYKEVMENENLTDAQKKAMLDQLKKEQQQELDKAKRDMKAITDMTGYDPNGTSSQSASVQAMERITVDQADELIGRMNAGQMIWEQGNELSRNIIASLATMNEVVSRDVVQGISDLVSLAATRNQSLVRILDECKGIRDDMELSIDYIKFINDRI